MSQPVSQPVIPAQPNRPYYGVSELALFKTYTRDSYRAAFGVEAPPFNPDRVIKTWFDSTADTSQPENVTLYNIAARGSDGQWGVRQLVIPSAEAVAVNLPGAVKYPTYIVPPTQATRGGSIISAIYMSLEGEARELMADIGGTGIHDEILASFPTIYPANEPRRVWLITFKGSSVNAGLLLLAKNANGVGAPGQWDLSGAEPVWVPDPPAPTGEGDSRPPRPLPIRPLLPNERFHQGLMDVQIERTDLKAAQDQASGLFTTDDRAMLQAIFNATVKKS
jgi:hypothetical protein